MNQTINYLLILAYLFSTKQIKAGTTDSIPGGKATSIIDSIKKKYAPDKRTAIFNTNFKDGLLSVETTEPEAAKALTASFEKNKIYIAVDQQLLPEGSLGDSIYAIANLSVCNNRTTPANSAEMATQMILGTPVQILKKEKGYYLVRTPDGYISWTDEYALGIMDEAGYRNWQKAEKIVFTAAYGHSYQQPSGSSLPVSDLVSGNILQLSGKENGFYKVVYPDKRIGFVRIADAEPYQKWVSRPNPTKDQLLSTAKTLIGVPYLWGGTSVKGMDCSGFTKTSFFLNGIIIPRDASQQALAGQEVDILENDTVSISKCLKNLQAGDMLFFAAGKNRYAGSKVTHTAIYMGKGQFIQAAGMVRINSMLSCEANYDDFQSRTIVGARRYLNSVGKPEITRVSAHDFYNEN